MPRYLIEQYELHTTDYDVEAANEAEAIAKLLNGEAEPVELSQEFIQVAERVGLPVAEHHELAKQLRELGVFVDQVIPSIRRIEQVE